MVVKIERYRYLKVEFYGDEIPINKLVSALRYSVKTLGGELSLAESGLYVVDYTNNVAIIRCTHNLRDLVEAAIQLLDLPNMIPVVRMVSGTLKALSKTVIDDIEETEDLEQE